MLKSTLWISSLTVEKSVSIAGTQLVKRNSAVLETDTSQYFYFLIYYIKHISYLYIFIYISWIMFVLQHQWAMRYHHVWCDCAADIQECAHLASWSLPVSAMFPCSFHDDDRHHDNDDDVSGSAKTSLLFFAAIRWTSRTGKWRQSRWLSTGRRIFSTTRSQPKATTISRSRFSILLGNLPGTSWLSHSSLSFFFLKDCCRRRTRFLPLGIPISILSSLRPWPHLKCRLT